MTKPIDTNDNQTMFANSICLPEKWQGTDCHFKPTPNCEQFEYGMFGGWGSGHHPRLDNLQVGYWRLYNWRWTIVNESIVNDRKVKLAMGTGGQSYSLWCQYIIHELNQG